MHLFLTVSVFMSFSIGCWEEDFQYVKREPPEIVHPSRR